MHRLLRNALAVFMSTVLSSMFTGAAVAVDSAPPGAPSSHTRTVSRARLDATTSAHMRTTGWVWPLWPITIVEKFRAPATEYSSGHRGLDIARSEGVVRAPHNGVVHFAGWVGDRPLVTLKISAVLITLEPVEALVSDGQIVSTGEIIGSVAAGGHCGVRCLHVGTRVNGHYVNPLLFWGGVPHARLLPLTD